MINKKVIYLSLVIAISALIRLNFMMEGFVIALSVVMLSIFIYTYEDITPISLAFCTAIFSPFFRGVTMVIGGTSAIHSAILVFPDCFFFIAYGIIIQILYKYVLSKKKSITNFALAIMFCEYLSNLVELSARGALTDQYLITSNMLVNLMFIAAGRTILVACILMAVESYGLLLLKEEHEEQYQQLAIMASQIGNELYMMKKNASEIEDIMKDSYDLHRELIAIGAPKTLKELSLAISKNAHEIKGDYMNTIMTLSANFLEEFVRKEVSIKDIVKIVKNDITNFNKKEGKDIEFFFQVKTDFYTDHHFEMMSILRNLLVNAVESIDKQKGKIYFKIYAKKTDFIITVEDNGKGIKSGDLDLIFDHGFSSKFCMETGDIYRGVGLAIVKGYIENLYSGNIEVESEIGVGSKFTIKLPRSIFEGEDNEILHN